MIRELYPAEWEAIALALKQARGWRCENCGKDCQMTGEDWLNFMVRLGWTVGEALDRYEHPKRYELDAAHPHHDPENSEAELRAWCNPCHCRYNLKQIARKRWLRRKRDGQLSLPLYALTYPEPAGHGKNSNRIQLPIQQEVDE